MRTIVLSLALACGIAGCGDRSHLTPSYGRAYQDAMARQMANPNGQEGHAVKGLDSQEAGAITDGYRHTLAGKNGGGGSPPVMMLAPNGGTGPYVPTVSAGATAR
jgi:hypothetical protein